MAPSNVPHQSRFERLLDDARAGSLDALGELLNGCREYLQAIAERELDPQVRTRAGGSDLVQETLGEACQAFDRFHGAGRDELLAWLRQILLNNLKGLHRDQRAAKRSPVREVPLPNPFASSHQELAIAAKDRSPSSLAAESELANRALLLVETLPEQYRAVILLYFRDHRSFEQIATETGRSIDSVRKLWRRGIDALAVQMKPLS